MNTTEQMNSIGALSDCMEALGFPPRLGKKHIASARIRHASSTVFPGEIDVCFVLLDMTNGPEIDCDANIIKSYGIQFGNFRPWFQRFSFDKESMELRISCDSPANRYDFIFCFGQ